MRVSGTKLMWPEEKPGFSRSMETLIHAQRSRHQFSRNGIGQGCEPQYGQAEFEPSTRQGLHWTSFHEVSINSSLESERPVDQGSVADQLSFAPGAFSGAQVLLWVRGFLKIDKAGLYWFRTAPGNRACLGINRQLVLDQFRPGAGTQASIELEAGLHAIDVRFLLNGGSASPVLQWVTPGFLRWRWRAVPGSKLRIPAYSNKEVGMDNDEQEQG